MNGSPTTRMMRRATESAPEDRAQPGNDAALENCPKCNALLDVSGCRPLTETSCPICGELIKVLREFHHFVLLSELGQGGAGTVFRAFDETLERDVALKLLRNEHTRDPKYLESLEREALIMASISHPHVVKVYSTGTKNGYFYVAMEIVPGGTLADRILHPEQLTEAIVLSIGIQLAEGLRAAYEHGLLHRDVKPGNILFSDREMIKVGDFGLALALDQTTNDADDLWGTPDYIAPEKLLRQGEDHRSDIYSLGCTIYHCLTGVPPLDTTTVWRVVETQIAESAPDIKRLRPDVSESTAAVIRRCLEKEPADRFQSYHELIETLQHSLMQIRGPKAAAEAPKQRSAEPVRRKSKTGMWVALGALLGAMAVIGGMMALRQKSPQTATASRSAETPMNAAVHAPAEPAAAPIAQKYQSLDLRSAFTSDTRRPMYSAQLPKNALAFTHYGKVTVNGIPFELADPDRTGFNVVILQGHKLDYPKQVGFPVAELSIRKLYILGGIAAWGWDPAKHQYYKEPVAKLTVVHRGGELEEFTFLNGVEIADHQRIIEVPGSFYADGLVANDHQIRTLSVELRKSTPVESINLQSLHADIVPIFAAITAELAPPEKRN
jgi:hypothetical protein